MVTHVECCIRNLDRSTRERLESTVGAGVTLLEKPCLQRCGDCMQGRFVVVDGEFRAIPEREDVVEAVTNR